MAYYFLKLISQSNCPSVINSQINQHKFTEPSFKIFSVCTLGLLSRCDTKTWNGLKKAIVTEVVLDWFGVIWFLICLHIFRGGIISALWNYFTWEMLNWTIIMSFCKKALNWQPEFLQGVSTFTFSYLCFCRLWIIAPSSDNQ